MTYAYNPLGERTTETPTGQTAYNLAYNQAGELTSYANGSTTLASDTYDATGLRETETAAGTTYKFAYDTAAGTPLILTDGQNNYIYGPSSTPVEQISTTGAELYLYHDALGSVRRIANQAGSVVASDTYDSYGAIAASTGTTTSRFGYAGAYTDPTTGLLYLDSRYDDPQTGQFLTVDPLVQETQQPYQYATGSPVAQTDPLGLEDGPADELGFESGFFAGAGNADDNPAGDRGGTPPQNGAPVPSDDLDADPSGTTATPKDDASGTPDDAPVCSVTEEGSGPSASPNFSNPSEAPGPGWEWIGKGAPGSSQGSWYNPSTDESLHPDFGHGPPFGPHYDHIAPDGPVYRLYPDGSLVPK